MSTDPSPWSEGIEEPEFIEPTAEMLARETDERAEEDRERAASARWWSRLAHRMAADGTLIR